MSARREERERGGVRGRGTGSSCRRMAKTDLGKSGKSGNLGNQERRPWILMVYMIGRGV